MSRKPREKDPELNYHVICRSISELLLFPQDSDMKYYMQLLKRYCDKFFCVIYAYSLMNNHVHLQIDTRGFDISTFMHCLNTAYVVYYNRKYDRHGSLYQNRFISKVVRSACYNMNLSAYIHNNAKDIPGYEGREEYYPYSSYGVYLGIREDPYGIIDKEFLMELFCARDEKEFVIRYRAFVKLRKDMSMDELSEEEKTVLLAAPAYQYESQKKVIRRDLSPAKILAYITRRLAIGGNYSIAVKGRQKLLAFRSFCAYVLRVLGGMNYREICSNIYNMTASGCSRLCDRGHELLRGEDKIYSQIFNELVEII